MERDIVRQGDRDEGMAGVGREGLEKPNVLLEAAGQGGMQAGGDPAHTLHDAERVEPVRGVGDEAVGGEVRAQRRHALRDPVHALVVQNVLEQWRAGFRHRCRCVLGSGVRPLLACTPDSTLSGETGPFRMWPNRGLIRAR